MSNDRDVVREHLRTTYGEPLKAWSDGGYIYRAEHRTREAAEAYAAANVEHWDLDAHAEEVDGVWLSVVDISRAVERMKDEA